MLEAQHMVLWILFTRPKGNFMELDGGWLEVEKQGHGIGHHITHCRGDTSSSGKGTNRMSIGWFGITSAFKRVSEIAFLSFFFFPPLDILLVLTFVGQKGGKGRRQGTAE